MKFKEIKTAVSDMWASMSDGGDVAAGTFTKMEKTTSSLSAGFNKLSASSKAFLGISAGIIAITVAMKAFEALDDKFTLTSKTAQKHLEESTAAYSDTKSELESLKSQTDEYKSTLESIGYKYDIEFTGSETVDEMIDKLQSIDGGVDVADEASIKKLERQNELLKTQESILNTRATAQQKQAAEDARTAINFASEEIIVKDEQGNLSAYSGGGIQKTTVDRKKYVQEQIKEMERAQAEIEEAQAKIASGDTSEKWAKQFENATADLEEYKNNASSILSELNAEAENFYDAETGLVLSGFEEDAKAIESLNDAFNNFDLSPAEKQLKSIENFFDGSSGKNFLKDYLLDSVEQGGKASDAIQKLGIDLEDAGLNADTLNRYFEDMAKSADDAADAINSVDGSVAGVKGAGESADQDANWTAMAEARTKAVEAYNKGRVGTDDFQTFVQFMTNKTIDADAGFKYDADAYVQYWQEASSKAKRYFDENNPLKSVKNFANDLVSNDLATKIGNEYTWAFDNTAQAADALGISVDAVETLMHGLEAYGAEFDDVMFSGEGLDNYESKLEGIKSLYDSMGEGSDKDRLGRLIDGWDENLEKYEADLDSLTQDQIIHLEFEYDLATIRAEIDELKEKQRGQGGKDATTNAEIIAANEDVLSTQREGLGLDTGDYEFEVKFKLAQDSLENLYSELESTEYGSDEYFEIQAKIQNAQELESSIYDLFSEQHPEINAESNPKEIEAAWKDFFSEPHHFKVEGEIDKDSVESQLEGLSFGSTIEFTADVDGVETAIQAVKNEDGIVSYQANVNGVIVPVSATEKDGTVIFSANTTEPDSYQPADKKSYAKYRVDSSSVDAWQPKTKFGKLIYNIVTNGSAGGKGPANGTAHSDGTALWQNYRRETRQAYAGGHWGLRNNANGAMINELGEEIIVRDGQWFTVNNGYPSLTNLKKGDIIFNHKQTEQIKKHGYVTGSHAKLAYANGSAFANGWQLGGGAVTGGGSSKGSSGKSSNNSSSNSSSSSDSADEFRETLDEIEILLGELERDISNLDTIAQGSYRNWAERNQALGQEMSKVTELINVQQQAYNKYMEKANSIGLSADWVDKILNGKLAIEDITDEDLHDKIKEFEDWSSKAKECSDAILELQDDLADLASQKFENTKQEYEDLLSTIEHRIDMIDGSIDKIETQGYLVSTKMYEQMTKSQQDSISMLEKEYSALQAELSNAMASGDIKRYSEEWYSLVGEIQDVEKELQDVNTELIETKNNMRELEWEIFDRGQDMISELHAESEFLRDLMSNEKMFNTDDASITEHGQATLGLHAVSYNAYMSQAQDYAKEIQKINAELANDPYNTILLDKRSELLESQREMIENAEDEKAAIKDLVEEGYDTFLDVMDKLIEKRMDMFDNVSDLYDFQKEITDFNKEIASLEKQAMALRGDDSETAKASIQQIKIDLEEARQNRDEAMYDKYRSDTEKMLNLMMDETELWINERLDNEALLLQGVIDSTNLNASEIRDTLVSETEKVGTTLSSYMQSIWGDGGTFTAIVSTYNNGFTTQLTTTNSTLASIKELLSKMIEDSNKKAEAEISKTDKNTSQTATSQPTPAPVAPQKTEQKKPTSSGDGTPKVGDKVTFASGNYFLDSEGAAPTGNKNRGGQVYITSINNASWAKKPYHISTGSKLGNGDLGWVTLDQLTGYSTGGFIKDTGLFVGHGSPNNPEIVLKPYDSENFVELRDTLREINSKGGLYEILNLENMFGSMKTMDKLPKFDRNNVQQNITIDMGGIEMHGVNDVETFAENIVYSFQHNRKVRDVIMDGTVGVTLGKGKLGIMKY